VATDRETDVSQDEQHELYNGLGRELTINSLPTELIRYIFSFFSQQELSVIIAPVCHMWYDLAYDPVRWRSLEIPVGKLVSTICSDMLCRLPMLESLIVCSSRLNHALMSSVVADFFGVCAVCCPNLLEIRLRFIAAVNSEVIDTIVDHFPNLQILSIEGCEHVNAGCIHRICDLSQLTQLDISHCPGLTDDEANLVTRALVNLEDLNTDGLNHLTDR
jgi:Leucine-rich repeat (LRR) protein